MLKRILYGAGFVLLIAVIIILLFYSKKEVSQSASLKQAVPQDAVLFADQLDYSFFSEDFIVNSDIWNAITRENPGQRFDSLLTGFVNRLSRVDLLHGLFIDRQTGISIHLVGREDLVPVFYINYSSKFSDKEFRLIVEEVLGEDAVIERRKYESAELCDVRGTNPWLNKPFTYTLVKGLFILSPVSVLVEEAVRNLQEGLSITDQPGFRKIEASAGRNVQGNIYLSYPHLSQLFVPFTEKTYRWKLDFPGVLSDWGEMDINLKKDALALTGMTWSQDSAPRILNIFRGQDPVKMDLPGFIPSNAISCLILGISDKEHFREKFGQYLVSADEFRDFEKESGKLKETCGIDPVNEVLSLIDNEAGFFTMNDSDLGEQHVTIVETRSRSLAEDMLQNWADAVSQAKGIEKESMFSTYRVDDQTSFLIVRFDDLFYSKGLAGKMFSRYFTVYDNLLLSGSSEQALTRTIYQNILHKTLSSDHVFNEISDYLASKANITFYFRPQSYLELKKPFLSPGARSFSENMKDFTGGISGAVLQFVSENDLFYQNFSLKYSVTRDEKALTLWESLLDTVAMEKPVLVVNANTNEKEIFLQDARNTIYLINSAGRILWRKRLDGPILSEIYQIDLYQNGKLQYLFNTPDKLYMIDRNSNNVEKFPVSLRSRATNGIGLFDYDNKGEYRIFIACTDRRIYVYDKSGNLVTGWNFAGAEKQVTGVVQHFRVRDKDYIVFADAGRTYILDRQGHERVSLKSRIPVSQGNQFYLDMNIRENKPRLVTSDTAGNVIGFGFDGSVNVLMQHSASSGHHFRLQDLDQDGIGDYIFADRNELTVFSGNGKKLYTYRVRGNIKYLPDIYRFSASDIKVGITEEGLNRIYLINSDGSLYDGFPLDGNTRFSIGNFSGSESRFNLVVGSQDSFLYNYSIE